MHQNRMLGYCIKNHIFHDKTPDYLGFRREIVNIYRLRYLPHRGYIRTPQDLTLSKGLIPAEVRFD